MSDRRRRDPADPAGDQLGLFASPASDDASSEALTRDAAARALAQREFERPLLIEAGAGTGKTTTLTARILAWSLGPGWERGSLRVAEREAAARPLAPASPPDPEAVAAEVLSRVVAITFTEAAAAEMASRIGRALAELAAATDAPPWLVADSLPPEPERASRARCLLGALDHLVVRTIHAFCRSLLAAHPLEAGLHPELQVDADGARIEEIAREVVEESLRAGYGSLGSEEGDPDLLALAGRGLGPAELVGAVVDALAREGLRPEDLERSPFSPERTAALRDALATAVARFDEAVADRLDGLARSKKTGEVLDAVRATGMAAAPDQAGQGDATIETLCGAVKSAWNDGRDSLRGRLKDWAGGRFNKSETEALAQGTGAEAGHTGGAGERSAEAVAAAAGALLAAVDRLRGLDPKLLEQARRVLAPLLTAVRHRMRLAGVATFHDLLAEARDLLVGRPDVARRARRRIDQLLVDELQDTDRLQVEVITALALDGPTESRPGLFLVGDPKQSIYGWRNADLRAYEALWERVRAAGGERRILVENFRSVPAILDEVTRAVEPVMVERAGLQPRFEPLVACERLAAQPGFARDPWAPVEYWVSWLPDDRGGTDGAPALAATRSGDATRLEAGAIARDLTRLKREQGVAWSDAAILLRSFSDLDDYLEALRREGVRFAVTGDRQYYRRREVIDAAALVRAVIDPGDHLALLTVLRSPAVGVPDAALLPLWREGFPRRMTELGSPPPDPESPHPGPSLGAVRGVVQRALERMPPATAIPGLERVRGWQETLLAAVGAIERLRRSFAEDPADRFVERLRTLVPLELIASARHLGAYRLANLDRFFRRLGEAMESSAGDTTAILRALRRGVSEALEEEEGRPPRSSESADEGDEAEDAVQVMTIHKAKGLDFAHVYLAQLHKTAPPDRSPEIAAGRVRRSIEDGDEDAGDERIEYCLFGAPTPGFAEVREESRRVEAAERVRTLYVAMTRAEERLVLTGAWPDSPRPRPPEDAGSYLDLLGSRFPSDLTLADLWEGSEEAGGRIDRHQVRWVFPALISDRDASSEEPAATRPAPALPSAESVAADSEKLLALRAEARRHSRRPLGGAVSAASHRLLEAAADSPGEDAAGGAGDRWTALAVGTAVHRVLEELDLEALARDAEDALATARQRLPRIVESALPTGAEPAGSAGIDAAVELADTLLDHLALGPLLERLREIASPPGAVLARELPLLACPEDSDHGPIAYLAGSVDLLYRDPETGLPVVADYKTDRIEDDDALQERARLYAPQARSYARALQEALDLPEPPRAELWFLWPGRVVDIAP